MKKAIIIMLILFSNVTYAKYLGNLNANPYDPDSVSNPYGQYGSKYSPDSINNPYGTYGSPYSPYSANNPYTTTGPSIYSDDNGSPQLFSNDDNF